MAVVVEHPVLVDAVAHLDLEFALVAAANLTHDAHHSQLHSLRPLSTRRRKMVHRNMQGFARARPNGKHPI